jgi:outer membrane protein
MKKTILILLAAFISMTASAQMKTATVNSNELVMSMPETKALQAKIQEKSAELSKQLETMYKQYETKMAELKGINPQKMTAIEEAKVAELQDLQKRIEKFEQSAQKEVQQMEQTLSVPILEKAKKMIEQVASERGYTHVFDVSAGGMIVFPKGDDITDATKTKMGIALTPANATPAPTGSAPAGMPSMAPKKK